MKSEKKCLDCDRPVYDKYSLFCERCEEHLKKIDEALRNEILSRMEILNAKD